MREKCELIRTNSSWVVPDSAGLAAKQTEKAVIMIVKRPTIAPRKLRVSDLTVEIVQDITALEQHVAAWQDLAVGAAEPNVFYEPWMLLPRCEHLAWAKTFNSSWFMHRLRLAANKPSCYADSSPWNSLPPASPASRSKSCPLETPALPRGDTAQCAVALVARS